MNKKKILGICTSPRKNGQTSELLKAVLAGAEAQGAEVELFQMAGKDLNPCMGCHQCQRNRPCPIEDDIKVILEKIKGADGLVIGSPVFFYDVNAQCKMMIDRSYAIEPVNGNKVGAIVTTAGSMGVSDAVKTLNMFYTVHGITGAGFVASYGKTADNVKGKEAAYALGQKMVKMAKVLGEETGEAFNAHTHFAYGTHTF